VPNRTNQARALRSAVEESAAGSVFYASRGIICLVDTTTTTIKGREER